MDEGSAERRSSSRSSSAAHSELSIDDLSLDKQPPSATNNASATRNQPGATTDAAESGMESKLRRNLRAQQAHYARQRQLFEDLRADAATTPPASACCSSAASSPVNPVHSPQLDVTTDPVGVADTAKTTRFKLDLPREAEEEKGETAREAVQRVKDRALADYKRRIACYHHNPRGQPVKAPRKAFVEELEQQEASNDALRRQLELLRRLQVDNNRFRVENRTLRERNEALSDAVQVREREVELLKEEVADKSARINRDQASLSNAAQTSKKLKAAHKQLASAYTEVERLREALEEAVKAQEDADAKALEVQTDAATEVKRLKKTNKQLRQRENSLCEDAEGYRSSIEDLERVVGELRARVADLKRERSKLTGQLTDKTAEYERYEVSTAECVHQLQEQVSGLQQALVDERSRVEKAESELETMETQVETLEAQVRDKSERLEQLETERSSAQLKFQERRRAYREHVAALEEKLELCVSNQRADAETIGNLRRQSEAVALQVSERDERAEKTAKRTRVEVRGLRRALDLVRKYVEQEVDVAAHSEAKRTLDDTQALLTSPRLRGDIQDAASDAEGGEDGLGDFQVARAAASALRHAVMDAVHELQRARHVTRQQVQALASQRSQSQEMERRRREEATALEKERERREVAEQAREIAVKEKAEVLQWGEQACCKAEEVERKLKEVEDAVNKWTRRINKTLRALGGESEEDEETGEVVVKVDKRLDELLAVSVDLKRVVDQQAKEIHDLEESRRRLESEVDTTTLESKRVLEEVEALHHRNVEEVKRRLKEQLDDLESEKQAVSDELKASKQHTETQTNAVDGLQLRLKALESDVPVLVAIAQLFAVTVRPLIQQVSDLVVQKRLVQRENAELALQFGQIKCVGQVLKEMLPSTSQATTDASSYRRGRYRALFRRVVIAVFAFNRLRRLATSMTHNRTVYGFSTALLTSDARSRAWSRSLEPPATIKTLSMAETVAQLSARDLMARLKPLDIPAMLDTVVESEDTDVKPRESSTANVGGLVLKVLSAMDASASDLLVHNVSGAFHCQALLERRRCRSSRQAGRAASTRRRGFEYEVDDGLGVEGEEEDAMPVVELIQQRIIALGRRVEDLHFQRNTLQKDNYELQFQLEQQAVALTEMETLTARANALQQELGELRDRGVEQQAGLQAASDAKNELVAERERELDAARREIAGLEQRLQQSEARIKVVLSEKVGMEKEIDALKQQAVEDEAKADKARADGRRQQEELKQLTQAVKRAHELLEKAQTRLELETMDKAALQASIDHLRLKHEQLERELRDEKRREVERSFDVETELAGRRTGVGGAGRPSPTAVSFEDLAVKQSWPATSDDSDEEEVKKVSDARPARLAVSSEQFMREWQRLDVSTAFADAPSGGGVKERGERREAEAPASPPAAWLAESQSTSGVSSLRKPATRAELTRKPIGGRSQRAVEIDKVNAAVHDYMDRIDDKLSKMYGIPPSSAVARGRRDDVEGVDHSGGDASSDESSRSPVRRRPHRHVYG